ncbi:MAG TPA: M48 family metallopeptidase [archaeon]|nr:M48 family metallopeptidase [archaeon]
MVMNFYDQIAENKKMTYFLFGAFFLLIGTLAFLFSYLLGGFNIYGLTYFTIFGILIILFAVISYFSCDSIVAAVSGAKEVSKEEYKQLYNIVEELSLAGGVPMPKIFLINDSAINAFATGRDPSHAIICITTGSLNRLDRDEVQGVIAHELSHIKNYDVRTMTFATVLVGVAVLLSDMLLRFTIFSGGRGSDSRDNKLFIPILIIAIILAALTPLIANLIKLSISRKREFMADASAVELTRNPLGLASALEKISNDDEPLEAANKATAHLYISDPLKNSKGLWLKSMFSTHPPLEERINALKGIKN